MDMEVLQVFSVPVWEFGALSWCCRKLRVNVNSSDRFWDRLTSLCFGTGRDRRHFSSNL